MASSVPASIQGPLTEAVKAELARFQRHLRAENKADKTIATYGEAVTQLCEHLAEAGQAPSFAEISRDDVRDFVAHLVETRSASTAHNRFRALRVFFTYLLDEEVIDEHPMGRMKPPKVPERPMPVLTLDELAALLDVTSGRGFEERRDHAMLRLFIDTGARLSEIACLVLDRGDDPSDIDSDSRQIRVLGKGRRERVVPYGAKTGRALDRYLRARPVHAHADAPELWLARKGPMSASGIAQMVLRRGREAGIQRRLHTHLFRHAAAHHWQAGGGEGSDLMRLMGWRSPTMLQRYAASAADERATLAHRRFGLGDKL